MLLVRFEEIGAAFSNDAMIISLSSIIAAATIYNRGVGESI